MSERIVVSFRGVIPPGGDKTYLERALALKQRAEAHGATLCAWSALTFSFDFDPDELEEAASLAALAQESIPADERFGAGIAAGEMRTLGDGGGMAKLGWGAPLVAATLLSRDARVGEVLIDGELLARRGAELLGLGFRVSGERRQLLPTDRASLPPPSTAVEVRRASLLPPPPSAPESRRASLPPPPPPPPPSVSVSGTRRASLPPPPALDTRRLSQPPPPPVGMESRRASLPPPPPPRVLQQSYPFGPPSAPPPPPSRGSLPDGGDHTAELARQALLQGNMAALDLLLEKLRVTGEHAELVERMAGLVALRRGATAEGLRRLRDAAESVKEPAQQARARLAYGVALAASGRTEGALLEALEALSRARAGGDAPGERACALFLARLSASSGHAAAASTWVMIAQGARD